MKRFHHFCVCQAVAFLFFLLAGCGPTKAIVLGDDPDADGDGYATEEGDCDDFDSSAHPGADELCDGVDNDCNGQVDESCDSGDTDLPVDLDGDGYATDVDCDDADPDVHPDAEEVCNGIDDDCDSLADNVGSTTFYADSDDDGYGDEATALDVSDCDDPPTGYLANADDCDDANADINPDADELCNHVDDNCDGVIDADAVDAPTWYPDADGDFYGDDASPVVACEAPFGHVTTGGDCDDTDPDVNPSESEVCGDGIDNDCDPANDASGSTWYADADTDGFGDAGSVLVSCTPPADYVLDATDCDDADASINPDADEVCNEVDDNCDGVIDTDAIDATEWYADTDNDGFGDALSASTACSAPVGYVSDATDCDDTTTSVNPDAIELCNGVDDNCDAAIDEGVTTTYYLDADTDGYGDSSSSTSACSAPAGYVSDATDCNDAAASVNPGQTEICNSADDDCDGSTDEGVTTTYYLDADTDGYGDSSSSTSACSAPAGYVANATDCNDANSSINPVAAETCDGVDEDCDGTIDDGLAVVTYYADNDTDGYGDAASSTTACTTPAGYVTNADDCDDGDSSINPLAAETCDGVDEDCDGTIDDGLATVTYYADSDGDGYGNASSTTLACAQPIGYVTNATDCLDSDATAYPGATEYCDDVDDDCDGSVDEAAVDPTTWWRDRDADGYGSSGSISVSCDAPAGYVDSAFGNDCNDYDVNYYPGAPDSVGDGADEDCDGVDG